MTVKTMRYEIVGWQGDPKAARERWRTIADDCREIVNVVWQQWECWHVTKGNDVKVREFAEALRAFRNKETKRAKPKLTVNCMPSELSKLIRRKLNDRFPGVHSRVKDLLLQITSKRMTGKDVDGRWNIWIAVLLNRQGRPNSTHDQPVPFDSSNCKPMTAVDGKFTNYSLRINLTRIPRESKAAVSIEDTVQLKARGSGLSILQRVVSGKYKFCGSSLVYHSGRRKWFALIAYNDNGESKKRPKAKGMATLHPTRDSPWALWHNGRYEWFGGRGEYVSNQRKMLLTSRWSRQENYRYAGSANKGHGSDRALAGVTKLSEGWKDFVKTANHNATAAVVKHCVQNGIARLVFLQPMGDKRDSRFLAKAGKIPGRHDSTGWDWSQVATMLKYKCKDAGVHLEIRKCDASGRKKKQQDAA